MGQRDYSAFRPGKGIVQEAWYSDIDAYGYCSKAKKLKLPFNHSSDTKCQIVSITSDGSVILAAVNKKDTMNKINGLYLAYKYSDGWDTPVKINITNFEEFISNTNTWGVHLAKNGRVLFIYKSISKESAFSEIFVSFLKNDTLWTEPVKVNETVNKKSGVQGNFAPFLAPDEVTLFFASDRKGGFGKADIYIKKFTFKNDYWVRPLESEKPNNSEKVEGSTYW